MTYTKIIQDTNIVAMKLSIDSKDYFLPLSSDNTDYAEYLSWLSATQEERDAAGVIFAPDEEI